MRHLLSLLFSLLSLSAFTSPATPVQDAVTPLWHFKPHDHALGDVHPYFHEGECFLYYLKPGKYEAALACSTDWRHWKEVELTHDPVTPEDWMKPYFVLGVFRDPETSLFRSFFGHTAGLIASSTSRDLRHWSCAPKEFHVPPADYYHRRRDPFVFWIPEMKQYGCVFTTWMKDRPKETGGAVGLATSPDLKQWKDHGPILDPGTIGEPECPQMFQLGGKWVLLASIYDRAVGAPVYWISGSPLGPWQKKPAGQLDGKDLCAAQIAFEEKSPLLFGWIPLKPSRAAKQTWGGHLALPREVHALPDGTLGTLGTRLPPKLSEIFARLPWVTVPAPPIGTQRHEIPGSWKRLAAEFNVALTTKVQQLTVHIEPLGQIVLNRDQLRILDAAGETWSDLPAELRTTQPVRVQIFVEADMIELFVQGRYSLAARLPSKPGPLRLAFQTDRPSAFITSLRISEWTPALPGN